MSRQVNTGGPFTQCKSLSSLYGCQYERQHAITSKKRTRPAQRKTGKVIRLADNEESSNHSRIIMSGNVRVCLHTPRMW